MKYVVLSLVGLLSLGACAKLDAYLPRATQCELKDLALEKAKEKGVDLETYLNTEELFLCADVEAGTVKAAE